VTYRSDISTSPPKGTAMAKGSKKSAPQAQQPTPHHVQLGHMAAQQMQAQPSNEIGNMGHFANLHENFQVAQPYPPGSFPTKPSRHMI